MPRHPRVRAESGRASKRLVAAVALAVVLVAVPIVFGLVGGADGALVGLAFSGAAAVAAGAAYALLVLLRRQADEIEARHRRRQEQLTRKVARLEARLARQDRALGQLNTRVGKTRAAQAPATLPQVRRERERLAKQVQDLMHLFAMVPVTAGLPTLGQWTASADLLVELLDRFFEERPAVVVEGGSGVSTVVLALAAREHGLDTRIVALEHDPAWAETTRRLLARHGVAEYAEVRVAPLVPTSLPDHDTPWYDESALADLTDVGLVLVDGPPESTGPRARYPMVPLLRDRLAHRCTILVDDTGRPGDRDVVERWRPLLPDFTVETLHLDKGAAVLTRK